MNFTQNVMCSGWKGSLQTKLYNNQSLKSSLDYWNNIITHVMSVSPICTENQECHWHLRRNQEITDPIWSAAAEWGCPGSAVTLSDNCDLFHRFSNRALLRLMHQNKRFPTKCAVRTSLLGRSRLFWCSGPGRLSLSLSNLFSSASLTTISILFAVCDVLGVVCVCGGKSH